MLVIRAGFQKILVRIANREDPDQTASSVLSWSIVCLGFIDIHIGESFQDNS